MTLVILGTIFLHVWAFLWPIASTVGTLAAAGWALLQAWPFIRRTFAVTDIVSKLPEQIAELKAGDEVKLAAIAEVKSTLDQHIAATADAAQRWLEREQGIDKLLADVAEVKHEVKHNGGTSIKDAVARIESAVTGGTAPIPRTTTTNTTSTSTTTEGST